METAIAAILGIAAGGGLAWWHTKSKVAFLSSLIDQERADNDALNLARQRDGRRIGELLATRVRNENALSFIDAIPRRHGKEKAIRDILRGE